MPRDVIKLPYVVNPTKIADYFKKILEVETPVKFTLNFLSDIMLFKSNNDRNLIPLLKHMQFLNINGEPTKLYSDYKISTLSKAIVAKGMLIAYHEIYTRKMDFYNLNDDELKSYVKAITGLPDSSSVILLIVKTLHNLIELADFTTPDSTTPDSTPDSTTSDSTPDSITSDPTASDPAAPSSQKENIPVHTEHISINSELPLKLNYTISINLPNSSNPQVYDMIFESIKKILLTK